MSRNIIAILRGINPDEAKGMAASLIDAGINRLEVPLNSPNALDSIRQIANHFSDQAHIGAGTVIDPDDVMRVNDAGGTFVVSPNCDKRVIKQTKALSMTSYPGVFTPTECFDALSWGADALKIFPAFIMGATGIEAIRAVLPAESLLFAVGGVHADNLADWRSCGVNGFGIGSALYKPGQSLLQVTDNARQFVRAYDLIF